MNVLANYTQEELCQIYNNLNSWEWDDLIGEKPKGFDELPRYNIKFIHKVAKRKTKAEIINPIMQYIEMLVPWKERLRYHHVHNLNSSNEQFEIWWQERSLKEY